MNRFLRAAYDASLGRLEGQYLNELDRAITADCDSLLDVGCGFHSPIHHLSRRLKYTVGVDGFAPALEESRRRGIHDESLQMSVLEIGSHFPPRSFDCVVALDLIEHLTEQDGLSLIAQMELLARKKVILFTPNGFLPQGEEYGNPLQRHLSGWTVDSMQALGYRVIGIKGFRPLRGSMAEIRWRPRRFWKAVSLLSQPLTRNRPRWAFQILCVKEVAARPALAGFHPVKQRQRVH